MRLAILTAILGAALLGCGGASSGPGETPACTGPDCPVALAVGYDCTCALSSGGAVRCWGGNWYGQLGNESIATGTDASYSVTPVYVSSLAGATQLATDFLNACALVEGGAVSCWGRNDNGQLGSGAFGGVRNYAAPVPGLAGVTAIAPASSGDHMCALVEGGAVSCWGLNTSGQLGNGTTDDSAEPVLVSSLAGATAVAGGAFHTCALLAGGTVKCWGENSHGQLGNGSTSPSYEPVLVSSLAGATAISAGVYHTCAIVEGGAVRCWGENSQLQLGVPIIQNSPIPVAVRDVTGAVALSAGAFHACVVVSGGRVQCWGGNGKGQLGNGTYDQSWPNYVNLADATAVAAGQLHSCAVLRSGAVACWGWNSYGQLGDRTTTASNVPVRVVF